VKLKLDENLGERCREILSAAGHDVATVESNRLLRPGMTKYSSIVAPKAGRSSLWIWISRTR
jgi:hypothetical protein